VQAERLIAPLGDRWTHVKAVADKARSLAAVLSARYGHGEPSSAASSACTSRAIASSLRASTSSRSRRATMPTTRRPRRTGMDLMRRSSISRPASATSASSGKATTWRVITLATTWRT
jgi:hypothetical protein